MTGTTEDDFPDSELWGGEKWIVVPCKKIADFIDIYLAEHEDYRIVGELEESKLIHTTIANALMSGIAP